MIRQPLTLVEIDLPLCANVFGTAPCLAALSATVARKCFNTRATCKDPAHYVGTATQTLRFGQNVTGLPFGINIFPVLQSVTTNPAAINLSGIDKASSALGKRARVTVTLQDFTYGDGATDPYRDERISGAAQFSGVGYQPQAVGTFWGKFIARHPYYVGKILRVRKGYVGDALSALSSATYVISEFSGPDAGGRVEIIAKDILDLAENTKAVAPAVSGGKLVSGIGAGDGTATLTPTGAGAGYAASGKVCIGREVIAFTRSGDELTLTRAQDGTAAASHNALDAVQECLVYTAQRPCDVVYDLLIRAGVPAGFITLTDWQAENDNWLSSTKFSAIITKATGVAGLIGEICQHGIMVWWDEVAQKIRLRANRPLSIGEDPVALNDASNFLRGSIAVDRGDDQRITSVIFCHGMIDPTGSATDEANFARALIATVPEDLYGQSNIVTICSRWFGATGDDASAASIAVRLRNRYQATPKVLTATLDMKDRASLSLGAIISATTYLLQDDAGATLAEPMQVSSIEVKDDRVTIKAETWAFGGRYGFIAAAGVPDYGTAIAAQKKHGSYIVSAASPTFGDGTGPYIAF